MPRKEQPISVRFDASFERQEDGCWQWNKNIGNHGYGRISERNIDGRWVMKSAHRMSWEIHCGQIPAGAFVLHSCDNRRCVNPAHLRLGSATDNAADMVSRNRQARGIDKQSAKLVPVQVMEIRKRIKAGDRLMAVSSEFGISKSAASMIANGKRWKHIQC